ncbi:MAG: M23 family metallopeptidase [Spirochaetaceae bacterium]|jgi:hypothetical protein|nr:M23 family metallopeptidase [Spirochaetaceae bacterium]
MKKLKWIPLFFLLFSVGVYSQILMVNNTSLLPGECAVAFVYPKPSDNDDFILQKPDGMELNCPGMTFNVPGYGAGWLTLIPIAADCPTGQGSLRWMDQAISLEIKERSFDTMRIPLSEDPQPEGSGENRLYRQLGRFNKDQRYWNGEALPLPLESYILISSPYGQRRTFTRAGRSWNEIHQGIDYAQNKGTPVFAPTRGRVVISEMLDSPGNLVVVEFFPGVYQLYYHLDSRSVARGDMISQGQILGRVGTTGKSTGPHLHFEIRVHNVYVDPQFFLDGHYDLPQILPEMLSAHIMGNIP